MSTDKGRQLRLGICYNNIVRPKDNYNKEYVYNDNNPKYSM
jgi:hypothetical protein